MMSMHPRVYTSTSILLHQGRAGRQFSRESYQTRYQYFHSHKTGGNPSLLLLESKRIFFIKKLLWRPAYKQINTYYIGPIAIEIQYIYNIQPTNPFIYLSICHIPRIKITGYRGYLKKYYAPHPLEQLLRLQTDVYTSVNNNKTKPYTISNIV